MIIQWYGQSCFKIQSGDMVITTDPFSNEIGLTPPRFKTDLALITHNHSAHNNFNSLGGEPFLISGPGEYEVRGIHIKGLQTWHDNQNGKERGVNTAYKIVLEGINILHLGDFGEEKIRGETLEEIGNTDILMVPVGGKFTVGAEEAVKIIKQVEPTVVIPMHYKISGLKISGLEDAEQFLKEMGAGKKEALDKLTIKKKDIPEGGKTEVIILKAG